MRLIRIYFEGDRRLREGLREFLRVEVELAAEYKIKIDLVGAGKKKAEKVYANGQRDCPGAYPFILKDAEGPLPRRRPQHTYYWVEVMESWFVADRDAITKALGSCVKAKTLPNPSNVELIAHPRIFKLLSDSTRSCGQEKHYDGQHPPFLANRILKALDRQTVKEKSTECGRFLNALNDAIVKLAAETS